ncbi:MAG: anti-sigma factor antagonist [Mogibacterium sp.]|nr:anti-sigma factor antagonist [Mogibacterium sp.]
MDYSFKGNIADDMIKMELGGRVDSANADAVKADIFEVADQAPNLPVELDIADLEYISSAGLRVLLQLRKSHKKLRVFNVSSEVYEIFDMTGFNQMMDVQKAYRVVDVEGCEVIGKGANGTIYRIDMDNVVKVYNNADALEDIQNEREVARLALVLGIPTAISYDVVKVGDSYGSVFELLNAKSFSKILATEPDKMDWCVKEYTDLLRTIHGTEVPAGKLPDMKKTAVGWANFVKDHIPEEAGEKLVSLVEAVPESNMMLHGDYHTGNVELTGDEVLLIDMDTLAVGDPVFEFGSIFNAFIGFSEMDSSIIEQFQGFSQDVANEFWHKVLAAYIGSDDEDQIRAAEDKARIIGYTRLIRRSIRRGGLEDEQKRAEIEHWRGELLELLGRVDSLSMHA